MNVVFYSRKCQTSRNLLNILQNENLLGNFKLMCVDDNIQNIPPQITVVPTMIVTGVNKLLVAKEIFAWIQQIKFIRQQNSVDMNRRIIQQNIQSNAANSMNGPLGFTQIEQNSVSDQFAYKDIDQALPQSFYGLGDEKKNVIFTAPEQKTKMSKAEQDKLIKNVEIVRKEQETKYADVMKQQQMQAVMNSEREKFT